MNSKEKINMFIFIFLSLCGLKIDEQHSYLLFTIYHKGHRHTSLHTQSLWPITCSLRLKVNVSSASGKLSSLTAMKMVLLDSVESRKAAAFTASKSPVSTPSSWMEQAGFGTILCDMKTRNAEWTWHRFRDQRWEALPLSREGWGIRFQREASTKGPKTCNISFVQQGPPKVVAKRRKMTSVKMENNTKFKLLHTG